MSDSIFGIPPINGDYSNFPKNCYAPKKSVLNTLVATMIRINNETSGDFTVYALAERSYNELYVRSESLLRESFPSKDVALREMISEYRKKKQ